MATVNKKELIEKMEGLKDGNKLALRLGTTFGAGVTLIEVNPAYGQKKEPKYLMRWGKSEEEVKSLSPFMKSDKAKNIAGWVADRAPEWLG